MVEVYMSQYNRMLDDLDEFSKIAEISKEEAYQVMLLTYLKEIAKKK